MEDRKLYPPRYTISISGADATKSDKLALNFTGSLQDVLTDEIILELPTLASPPATTEGIIMSLYYSQIHSYNFIL